MTLPALTAENIASSATDGKYTVATTPATCTAAGSSVYTYHYGDKTLVAATVTLDKVPHSYGTPVYQDSKLTASCTYNCGTTVTATLTFAGGEDATGAAPTQLDVTFDGTSFTVTLPECTFERSGYAFTGWSNGTETVSGTITLKADDNVTLTAQWALVTTVSNEAELRTALAKADIGVITVAESFEIKEPVTISRDVTINLNDQGLTFTGDGTQLTIQGTESEQIDVILRSGSITFTTTAYVTSTCIAINLADVTIDDVNITTGTSAIFPAVATLTVKNSTITAFTYGIGTNASVKVEQDGTTKEVFGPVNLTIENSIVKTTDKDSTAVLFNVEGSLSIIDSDLEGGRQGLILRKGIGTVTGGSIASRWEYTDVDQYIPAEGAQAAWRTGNEVPMAAIVIGDTGKNYDGDAILTISGTEVKLGNTNATRYIYLWADTADATAAELIYACDDAYMSDLAAEGKIVCGNPEAEVTVTHAALTHYDAKEATCTEAGNVEYFYCETCDTYFDSAKEPTTAEALVISALGHTYGEWVIKTEPSASGKGVATITCSVCAEGTEGHTQSVTLPELTAENVAEEATAGKYTVVETKATCEAEGSTVYTYHFMFDGELMSLELPEIKHEQLEHVWNVTYDGTTLTASCPNGCGDSYTATLTLTGTGATVALGEAATFTVADGFAIDLPKLSVTKEEADVIRAYIANGSIVTGTQTVAANGTLALEVVVEDTSFTVGSLQTDAWSTPVWSDVLYPGEVITITGQHTSNAVTGNNNGFAMLALLYSGNIVWGAYRPDNYIIGGDDKGGSETIGVYYNEEGIQVDKVPTITWTSDGGTTFDVFQNVLANCTYTVTYNWAYETVIYVTITMEGTYNDTPYTNVSSYVVQAAEGNTLKDWYRIGLTCARAMYTNVSVTVHSEHEYVDNVCTVCGTYAPTLNLSVSQGDVTYTSTLNHIDVYKNNDTDPTWDGNGTSDLIDATGDFAITMFWENTRDVNYYDFRLNPVFNNGGIQLWEGDSSFDNYASGSEPTKSISITNSAGEVTTIPAAGTVNCGAGSYRAEIYRIGDVLTMKVYFTPATDSIQAWTITAVYTGVSENDCTVCMAGNPFWLDNIHAYYGTLTAQS